MINKAFLSDRVCHNRYVIRYAVIPMQYKNIIKKKEFDTNFCRAVSLLDVASSLKNYIKSCPF